MTRKRFNRIAGRWAIGLSLLLGVLASLFAVVLLAKARWMDNPQLKVAVVEPPALDMDGLQRRAVATFSVPTVSGSSVEGENLPARLHRAWKKHYSRTFARLKVIPVGKRTLILHWRGRAPHIGKPLMLLSHFDVAPVQPERWSREPFAGEVHDGELWGSGAKDGKQVSVAILESIEQLLAGQFTPRRDIYIVLTEDGEIGGEAGAAAAAEWLSLKNIQFEFVLAPGGFLANGMVPDIDGDLALVGIAEKSVLQLKFSVRGADGPAAIAHGVSAMSRLGAALQQIETAERRAVLTPPMQAFYKSVGHSAPLKKRVQIANNWLFAGPLADYLAQSEYSAAAVQNTIAVVSAEFGLPGNTQGRSATALVAVHMLPEESPEAVLAWVNAVVTDEGVSIEPVPHLATAVQLSSTDAPAYWQLEQTIREVFPEAQVAPFLHVTATDARYFNGMADNIYRFAPQPITAESVAQIHGPDERVSLDALANSVHFYARLIRRVGQ